MPTATQDIPAPSGSVQMDDHNRSILVAISHALNGDRFYAAGCTTDYEMLETIANLVAQRKEPFGLVDHNSGLRYYYAN